MIRSIQSASLAGNVNLVEARQEGNDGAPN
jgi:hypothetical protein